jgi:uncharacterized protein
MIRNTFCHIPGIGAKTERILWAKGLRTWDDLVTGQAAFSSPERALFLRQRIGESAVSLAERDARYFADLLPSDQQWRIFREFQDATVYLDIETSGGLGNGDYITTIATYDGREVRHYVRDQNLADFRDDVRNAKVLVTYNGKSFDIPVIENRLGMRMPQAHIDLRFLLKSLGYTGGLKGCEKKLGLDRDELDGVDGYCAVLLWNDYRRNGNKKALETLLAYNVLDAVNLEALMVLAYNLKVGETPFGETHRIPTPQPVENPFTPHIPTVKRIMEWRYSVHA